MEIHLYWNVQFKNIRSKSVGDKQIQVSSKRLYHSESLLLKSLNFNCFEIKYCLKIFVWKIDECYNNSGVNCEIYNIISKCGPKRARDVVYEREGRFKCFWGLSCLFYIWVWRTWIIVWSWGLRILKSAVRAKGYEDQCEFVRLSSMTA